LKPVGVPSGTINSPAGLKKEGGKAPLTYLFFFFFAVFFVAAFFTTFFFFTGIYPASFLF